MPGSLSNLRQWPPPSSLTHTKPSSVPTYSRFSLLGLSAIAEMFPYNAVDVFFATASGPHTLPITGRVLRSICLVRSGETILHESPLSSDRYSTWEPKYSLVCACGEMIKGESQFQRRGVPPFSSCG